MESASCVSIAIAGNYCYARCDQINVRRCSPLKVFKHEDARMSDPKQLQVCMFFPRSVAEIQCPIEARSPVYSSMHSSVCKPKALIENGCDPHRRYDNSSLLGWQPTTDKLQVLRISDLWSHFSAVTLLY